MDLPATTPGEPSEASDPKSRSVSRRIWLVLPSVLLIGAALFVWFLPDPPTGKADPRFAPMDAVTLSLLPLASRFDMPMGSESGALTYNAQPFTENRHLGDDLNGIGGENTDLNDPVYAVANGQVIYAGWPADGWGNMILVMHVYEENGTRRYVQSCYAHLSSIDIKDGAIVRRGQKIGTVGNANGRYLAHLHFELREFITPFIGAGYRSNSDGWLDPTKFIQQHRGAPKNDPRVESHSAD